METDTNNQSQNKSQGEVSQVNTSESVSNSQPPPDLSHLIDQLKYYKSESEGIIKFIEKYFNPKSGMYFYHQGRLDLMEKLLSKFSSLGIED